MTESAKVRVPHFVLDGATGGGKTTGAAILQKRLWEEKNVLLIVVPEIATMVFGSGIRQEEIMTSPGRRIVFEKNTLSLQRSLDKRFMTYAKIQAGRCRESGSARLVALCNDRGTMSIASFIGAGDFRMIVYDLELNVDQLRGEYGAVFILVTAADGAEEHYKNTYETMEQAREHQSRITEAWAGHKHIRVFPNTEVVDGMFRKISLEEKVDRLYKEVCLFLGV